MKSWYLKICLFVFFSLIALTWLFAGAEEASVDFLLYKGPHWMDSLTSEQVAELSFVKKNHYEHRYQPGDYVECQEGGKWSDKAAAAGQFYYLRVLGVEKKDVDFLAEPFIRDHTPEEELYHSEEADKEIEEIQKTTVIDVVEAKAVLMAQRLEYKPMAFKRRYRLDLSKLTVEEMKCFTDGEFLILSKTRHEELIKDKAK